jgi:hypothetical protein
MGSISVACYKPKAGCGAELVEFGARAFAAVACRRIGDGSRVDCDASGTGPSSKFLSGFRKGDRGGACKSGGARFVKAI